MKEKKTSITVDFCREIFEKKNKLGGQFGEPTADGKKFSSPVRIQLVISKFVHYYYQTALNKILQISLKSSLIIQRIKSESNVVSHTWDINSSMDLIVI